MTRSRVLSRAVEIAVMAVYLLVVYLPVVVGLGALLVGPDVPGPHPLLSLAATTLVAVTFQPVRRRVRRAADRLVLGTRATPYEVLSGFARRSDAVGDDPLGRVVELLAGGTGASSATVWLRVGEEARAASTWPSGSEPADGDTESTRTVDVVRDGETLGALSITKDRADGVTPTDEALLTGLAGGLGLVLRNRRLTAELAEGVRTLAVSRQRIVTTSDDVRRRLGRELAGGPEAQLLDCEARLAVLAGRAASRGAARTSPLVDQVGRDAATAAATLRGFADGVYPPVLESDGIGPALRAATGSGPLPVTVQAPGLARHPRDLEAAVYFCVLEALQNAAKYAGATTVTVRVAEGSGALRFTVADDGVGFDPATVPRGAGLKNTADRLETLGGGAEVDAAPGRGTTVRGWVPAQPLAAASRTAVSVSGTKSDLATNASAPAASASAP